jgi:hypothetical protein
MRLSARQTGRPRFMLVKGAGAQAPYRSLRPFWRRFCHARMQHCIDARTSAGSGIVAFRSETVAPRRRCHRAADRPGAALHLRMPGSVRRRCAGFCRHGVLFANDETSYMTASCATIPQPFCRSRIQVEWARQNDAGAWYNFFQIGSCPRRKLPDEYFDGNQ